MYLTIRGLLNFVTVFFLLSGFWQFIWIKITVKGWELEKEEGETFFQFCYRWYGGIVWKLRKRLHIEWFYNSKAFLRFIRLKGVCLICLAIALTIFIFKVSGTEYGIWLDLHL